MLLIKNARVYAPAPLGRMDILVAGGRIAAMEEALDPRLPGVEVLDAAGKTAVPGFIDQHVHITGGGGEGGLHTRVPELQLSAALRAGVTTLVGVLGTDSITRSVEGLVAKAKALTNEGVTAYCLTSAYQYPPLTLTGSVMKDIVFVSEILGCKLAIADHRGSHPTREEIIRLVSDIRMAALVSGKPGVLHMHTGADPAGIEPIMDIVRTTDIPICHFRPTHMGRRLDQAAAFTRMGGYADITVGERTAAAFPGLLAEGIHLHPAAEDTRAPHHRASGKGTACVDDLSVQGDNPEGKAVFLGGTAHFFSGGSWIFMKICPIQSGFFPVT